MVGVLFVCARVSSLFVYVCWFVGLLIRSFVCWRACLYHGSCGCLICFVCVVCFVGLLVCLLF